MHVLYLIFSLQFLIKSSSNSITRSFHKIRVFSRIAVIPFKEINEEQNLETCMFLDEKLKTITTHLAKSVGVLLELAPQFDVMHRVQIFTQISSQVKKNKLDARAEFMPCCCIQQERYSHNIQSRQLEDV